MIEFKNYRIDRAQPAPQLPPVDYSSRMEQSAHEQVHPPDERILLELLDHGPWTLAYQYDDPGFKRVNWRGRGVTTSSDEYLPGSEYPRPEYWVEHDVNDVAGGRVRLYLRKGVECTDEIIKRFKEALSKGPA